MVVSQKAETGAPPPVLPQLCRDLVEHLAASRRMLQRCRLFLETPGSVVSGALRHVVYEVHICQSAGNSSDHAQID
jgi:hypothetical protein